ncbi:MAG: FISUMP domain-containing protein [Polyangiaceae bacterium]
MGGSAANGGVTATGGVANSNGGVTAAGGAANPNGGLTTSGGAAATSGGGTSSGGIGTSGGAASSGGTATSGGGTSSGGTSSGGSASGGASSTCASTCSVRVELSKGTFCDARDNKTYACVVVGTQTWMAQNLDFGAQKSGASELSDDSAAEKYCYKDSAANCTTYGGLYSWSEAMGLPAAGYATTTYSAAAKYRGICPSGWHIPSSAEWGTLRDYADLYDGVNDNDEGTYLKSSAAGSWATNPSTGIGGPGSDDFGFTALGAGGRFPAGYSCSGSALASAGFCWGLKFRGMFWSSANTAENASLYHLGDDVFTLASSSNPKSYGLSLRCVQD